MEAQLNAKQADRAIANAAAWESNINPFPPKTRLWRYFNKARQHYEDMEAAFRDLELVYGPLGHRVDR